MHSRDSWPVAQIRLSRTYLIRVTGTSAKWMTWVARIDPAQAQTIQSTYGRHGAQKQTLNATRGTIDRGQ